jgi:pyridoxine 4-dehydrogenase
MQTAFGPILDTPFGTGGDLMVVPDSDAECHVDFADGSVPEHCIDTKVPRDEQFAAIKSLLDDGIIRHAGLSEVSVADIEAASKVFKVATVQNRYNLVDRGSEAVLAYCEKHRIGFIPWFPLAAGDLAKPGSILDGIAKAHGAQPSQIALARVLKRSPVMLPIPGTSKVAHLEENVAARQYQVVG